MVCARCLQQLLCAYAAMLFKQPHALTPETPARMVHDLFVFEELVGPEP